MKITIVGLGLIGGSIAMDAHSFAKGSLFGVDSNAGVLDEAVKGGVIDEGFLPLGAADALAQSDLTVICLYPNAARDFLLKNAGHIKPHSVVTDVLGVKNGFVEEFARLLPQAHYVGGHPMAGRELSGYGAAVSGLFNGCNYILTPSPEAPQEAVELVSGFAKSLGAGRVIIAGAKTHDRNIAYTSQLAHVLAAAVVSNPALLETKGFEGGSLGDITRVARLNSALWSELFVLNKDELSRAVGQLEESLRSLRGMIEAGDTERLIEALERSTRNKRAWEKGETAGD